jgi:outer membrane protein TolC
MKCLTPHLLGLLLLLSACVQFKPRPLSAGRSCAEFEKRSLSDDGLRQFLAEQSALDIPWNVDKLSLVAVYFHPDVALAMAEAEEVAARLQSARMRPNPVFTFSPQFASSRAPAFTPWFFGGNLQLPIETAGKRDKRVDQANAAAEAAELRVFARAWAARSRVRAALLDLHAGLQNSSLLEVEQHLHEEAIIKLTAQLQAGEVSPFELTQARLMLNRTRLSLEDALRVAASAKHRVAAAIGVPSKAIEGLQIDYSNFERLPEPKQCDRVALTQRVDLLALLSEYAAAEGALRLEVAKQYPDVNLGPGYDYNSGQNRWQLGFSLPVPFNRNRGPIAEAEARRYTAERRFLAQQAAIEGELNVAKAAYVAARAKATTAGHLAKEAARALQATRSMVNAGAVSALEVTRRQIEASTANLALQAALVEAQTAAGTLEDAIQAPLR